MHLLEMISDILLMQKV
uniref:Uncharacterized protein n=1 Tax=Anguilla anguilla TaxID=7936 RepID=A0A0E9QM05_ANGAN